MPSLELFLANLRAGRNGTIFAVHAPSLPLLRISRKNSIKSVRNNWHCVKPAFAKSEGRSPDMRFDLADLSLFRHVVEAGSITHGAERAHLALAAASTRIRNMED